MRLRRILIATAMTACALGTVATTAHAARFSDGWRTLSSGDATYRNRVYGFDNTLRLQADRNGSLRLLVRERTHHGVGRGRAIRRNQRVIPVTSTVAVGREKLLINWSAGSGPLLALVRPWGKRSFANWLNTPTKSKPALIQREVRRAVELETQRPVLVLPSPNAGEYAKDELRVYEERVNRRIRPVAYLVYTDDLGARRASRYEIRKGASGSPFRLSSPR